LSAAINSTSSIRLNSWLFDATLDTSSFFSNLSRIAEDSYVPSEQDVLRARVKTSGITEITFELQSYRFRCGGGRIAI
jgi:hypothetical protein